MKTNNIIAVCFMLLFSVVSFNSTGQVNNPISDIFPPSPNAGHLGSFAKRHVNKHVGALQLNIPLDNIEAGDISLPLALNYYSTGVKANQETSWVGMDWSLKAGGVITRKVVGKHDEFKSDWSSGWSAYLGFFYNCDKNYYTLLNQWNSLLTRTYSDAYDLQPDVFYFNFGKYTGKFFCSNQKKIDGSVKFVVQPHHNFDIECYYTAGHIYEITITAEDGTQYIFGDSDAIFLGGVFRDPNTHYPIEYNYGGDGTLGPVSAWYLRKIKLPHSNETIEFRYKAFDSDSKMYSAYSRTNYKTLSVTRDDDGGILKYNFDKSDIERKVHRIYLSEIETPTKLFSFSFSNYDFSLFEKENSPAENFKNQKLNRIDITDKLSGEIIRSIRFGYDDYRFRLTLRNVAITNEQNESQVYKMHYKEHYKLPVEWEKNQIDHWGFLNDAYPSTNIYCNEITFGHLEPLVLINDQKLYSDKGTNLNYTAVGMLEKLEYPTGAYDCFEYENNTYSSYMERFSRLQFDKKELTHQAYAGGARVSKIISHDAYGNSTTTRYIYEGGILGDLPIYITKSVAFDAQYGNAYNTVRFSEVPLNMLSNTYNNHVGYSKVTEILPDGSKIKSFYTNFDSYHDKIPYGLIYNWQIAITPLTNYQHKRGKLYKETYWNNRGGKVKEVEYEYFFDKPHFNEQAVDARYILYNYGGVGTMSLEQWCLSIFIKQTLQTGQYNSANDYSHTIVTWGNDFIVDYQLMYGFPDVITKKTVRELVAGGDIITEYDYNYTNDGYFHLREKIKTTSSGKTFKTTYTYPTDYENTEPYKTMISENIVSPVISQTIYQDEEIIDGMKLDYYGETKNFRPKKLHKWRTDKFGGYYEPAMIYDNYNDKGLITEYHKPHDHHTSVLYGFEGRWPVCKLQNFSITTDGGQISIETETISMSKDNATIQSNINTIRNTLPDNVYIQSWQLSSKYKNVVKEQSMNNLFSSYDYDHWGRLQHAKDDDGYVLKKYQYHIADEVTNFIPPSHQAKEGPYDYYEHVDNFGYICKVTDENDKTIDLNNYTMHPGDKIRIYWNTNLYKNANKCNLYAPFALIVHKIDAKASQPKFDRRVYVKGILHPDESLYAELSYDNVKHLNDGINEFTEFFIGIGVYVVCYEDDFDAFNLDYNNTTGLWDLTDYYPDCFIDYDDDCGFMISDN